MEKKYLDLLPEDMILEGSFMTKEVFINKRRLNINPSRRVWNKSEEFNWGYGGAGPSQMALAILLRYWDKETTLRWFQSFKFAFIGGLPSTDFIKTVNLREIMKTVIEKEESKI